MGKPWFYRLLFSYIPILFALSSALILLSYFMLSEMSRKETIHANGTFVQHLIQQIDYSLREIDAMLLEEMETDERIRQFFQPRPVERDGSYYPVYETSKKINQMVSFNPFIDSVYLYRYADHMVMSANTLMPLEQFGDRTFIEEKRPRAGGAAQLYELSDKRHYREFRHQELFPSAVVSIVRQYPMLEGGQGMVVVNISLTAIERMLSELSEGSISFVDVRDRSDNPIIGLRGQGELSGTVLSEYASPYTGWVYKGGVRDVQLFRFASVLSYVWVGGGLLAILAGAIWLTFVTRRNYRPIEALIHRIQAHSQQRPYEPYSPTPVLSPKSQPPKAGTDNKASDSGGLRKIRRAERSDTDEFGFIGQTFDRLLEQSNTYKQMQREDALFRRRHFFAELLEGSKPVDEEEWARELQRFDLPEGFQELGVVIYELDHYNRLAATYSYRDFHLLKFVLSSVIQEVAEGRPVHIWTEWIEQHRLAALVRTTDEEADWEEQAALQAEQVRSWVESNLAFTVTIGIGPAEQRLAGVSGSYAKALEALAYKSGLGLNRVIRYDELASAAPGVSRSDLAFDPFTFIQRLAIAFRTGKPEWRELYERLFDGLAERRWTRDEYEHLLTLLVQHLEREFTLLPSEVAEFWQSQTQPALLEARDTFDLIGDAREAFLGILTTFWERLAELRSDHSHHALIVEVRQYIAEEYANPDMSLNHLCDRFGLNGKYVSRLFKETFGEKLVDYLMRIRIEASQRLLLTTELSIQDIAVSVGYAHDISFIRAFKKLVGTTPGDYRKQHVHIG
ncbi:AraC family transcriptional regulator [Paenibacillus sp. 598K]|uniref:helix-turn-helix domain-containing protein n=1 Tax=Paenibacillus sp. 598K TaxID=1117987 RepID=UPI000FFA7AA6|nr:helix-turn-helix domain-containing protein [Paenibacillus sp. 598K]GBF76490.1 AraC family transcriptional regulator [Paenibacillus sp. 598K]